MTIVAPDVTIGPNFPPPSGLTVSGAKPLVIATNGYAGLTLRASSGAAEAQPLDAYGVPTGAATALPAPLATSGRWLVRHTGNAGESTPLSFT